MTRSVFHPGTCQCFTCTGWPDDAKPVTAPDLPAAVEAALRLAALTEATVARGSWPYIDGYSRDHGLADAATVRSALSALRRAQGEPVAWDRATDRRKHCDACDGSDAMMPRRAVPPPPEAVEALVKAAEAAAQGIREAAEIGIPAHRDYATAVFEALSALRKAQREEMADIDDDDVATVRLKYQRALDENDRLCAALRDAEAPPPPVDVAAWLEARASDINARASENNQMAADVLDSAADAYRREHGGK